MAGLMGLDWRQQKELLKLRGKLSFRQLMGEKAKIMTAVLTIVFLTPLIYGTAVATGAGYLYLPDPWPTQLLGFVLILSWIIWVTAPVFSFNVNEGLDPTRLLVYPVTRRDFLAHMLLGTLLDYPTYFLAPFALAIVVGFGLGWTFPIVLTAILLCYLLMVLTSQTIINTLGGVLKSRRFRDISMVVGAFVGIGCWLLSTSMQGFFEGLSDVTGQDAERFFQTWEPLDIMKWLPPGAAAKAIEQAVIGEWGGSLLWLGYTLIWVVLIGWVWWHVTHRIVTGEGFLLGKAPTAAKEKESKRPTRAKRSGAISWGWIPADIRLIAVKDAIVRWRTPQSRIGLIYMYLMPAFLVVYPLLFDSGEGESSFELGKYLFAGGITLYTMFVFWANGQNLLGWETNGLSTLLLTPIPRQRLFLGKVLAQFLMNGVPILIISILAIIIEPSLISLALLPTSIALGLTTMSVLVFASVLFPYPINIESQSGQNPFSGKGGCITGIVNTSLVPTLLGAVSLPVIVPLGLALWLELDWLALVGVFIVLPYAAVLFWFATRAAGELVVKREPEILVATRIKDDRG